METVLQSNCTHRWLHLMEGIFTSNIDACSERLIITNLANDLIAIYPYDEFEFWIILHKEEGKGGEYVKYGKISLRVMVYLFFSQHQKDGLK